MSRTLHYPLVSFIPGQPIYPASKDPSEWWHNHLVYQHLLPVLYSRSEKKFRWYSIAHRNVSQHSQTNKPSFSGSCLSEDITTAFTDSDDLHPESKGSLHEFQGMAVICTWQLEHTEFSASQHKSSSAKQPSQHQGHSTSTCSALCRQSSSPHAAHWCEHINKFSLQVTHYLFRK